MVVVKSSRYKNHTVSYKRTHLFRFSLVTYSNRKGNIVFLTTFNNSYRQYTIITVPLANGTYKIKVTDVDTSQNENAGVQGTATISFFPLPPQGVTGTLSGNNVTLSWTTSADGNPDNYIIYGNNGSGSTSIDRTTPIATIAGNLNTYTFAVANGNWSFVVESLKSGVQSTSMNKVTMTVPVSATVPNKPGPSGSSPLAVTGLLLSNVSIGCVNISFLWLYGIGADTFNVYHDNGTGTIDYSAPKYTFAVQGNLIQSYTTPQLVFVDGPITLKFAVRSVLAGVMETNKDEYSISVDGKAPALAQGLTVDTIF